ncbi:MAG: phosphatidate cytidylyltransferase [Bacteroidales bacterium]|jgi:phosphatidate cytidylyltransferase
MKRMKDIITRTITGTVYVSLIICSLIFHPVFLGILSVLMNLYALSELNELSSKLNIHYSKFWIVVNSFFFLISLALLNLGFDPSIVFLPFLATPVILYVNAIFIKSENPLSHLSFSLFATLYISIPLLLLNLVQKESLQREIPFALAVFIIIWTNDTFAYLAGISFGKHRIIERISPLKSWEGLIGGLVMVFPAVLVFSHIYPSPGLLKWVGFGYLTAASAVIGDFLESLIKRNAKVKDTGKLLPGHGGILDRMDSLLIAMPVIFIYLQLINKP